LPFSSWALIDQELWVLYVVTNSVSHPAAELGIANSRSSTSYNANLDNNLNTVQNNRPHLNNGVEGMKMDPKYDLEKFLYRVSF
jgi:hypothetical protein